MLLGEFGVGKITAQNKTKDVGYDAIRKQAAKFGNRVTKDGRPPLLREGESQGNKAYGYKAMNYNPKTGEVTSGADSRVTQGVKLSKGITVRMPGRGIYMSTNRDYVLQYYAGNNDHEALIKFEFDPSTITSGNLTDAENEFTVPQARVVDFEVLDQINEIESMELGKDWGEVSRWRWSGKNTRRTFKIATVAGLAVVLDKETAGFITALLVDQKKDNLTVGEIQLKKEDHAWVTDTSILDQAYQGRRIMLQVYVALCKVGMMLRSGESQSPGGKKIWVALSQQPGITVYAGNKKDGEWVYSDIDDDDEARLHGAFDIYDRDEDETEIEYRNEVLALQRNMDVVSAKFMTTTDPAEKAKYREAYKEIEPMLKKAEAEREAYNATQTKNHWRSSYLFAVANGVELNYNYQ